MTQQVVVSFGPDKEFEYKVHAGDVAGIDGEQARDWFDREFVALGCELPNPIGKVLVVDLVLSVARDAGVQRFRQQADWASRFARHAAVLLGRSVIRVDIANGTIGF